jgi:ketosteroid isomerase-like protein
MSQANRLQTVVGIYEAFGRGDVSAIVAQLTDDVRWVSRLDPLVPWSGDYSGQANVSQFFAAIAGSVDVTGFMPQEFIAQGDTVVSTGTFGCRVRSTGKSAESRWIFIWKFTGDRVSSYEQFHDPTLVDAFR